MSEMVTMQAVSKENSQKIANMSLVCAALVVFIHTFAPQIIGTPAWIVYYVIRYIFATIAVPFFFLVSGYFLAGHLDEQGWWKRESSKRIRTLLVPYFIWLIIKLLWLWLILLVGYFFFKHPININNMHTFEYWAHELGLSPFNVPGGLWYVRALFILVVISPLLSQYLKHTQYCGLGILFLVYYLVNPGHVESSIIGMNGKWLDFWRFGFSVEGLFYFSLGLFLRVKNVSVNKQIGILCGMLGLGLGLVRMMLKLKGLPEPIPIIALTIPFILMGVWSVMPQLYLSRPVTSLSFPIYVIHTSFAFVYSSLIGLKMGGRNETIMGVILGWLFSLGCSILLALGLRRWFPRFANLAFGGR